MKVKELVAELQEMDPDAEVILQRDSEGNGYSPLAGADSDCIYVKNNEWDGAVFDTTWTAEDADLTEDEWEEMLELPRCVVLYPVN